MDSFIIEHTLHQHQKQINTNRQERLDYQDRNDIKYDALNSRVVDLEGSETDIYGIINSLRDQVNTLTSTLDKTISDLNRTNLVNIKQDLVIRTMHNLQSFDAYGMFTDTFVAGNNIDWTNSIRAELMTDYQAVGKTRKSVIEIKQNVVTASLLISKNGSSDEAFSQTFLIDKNKEIDKVTMHVGTFSNNTYQPLRVYITDSPGNPALTEVFVPASELVAGAWVDIDLPDYLLQANKEYYLIVTTQDIYGYKIGMDSRDNYLAGTSFSLFNGVWTDNNFDLGFQIWCFPSEDENNATILTLPKMLDTEPTSIVFDREEIIVDGAINYYVSRDGGSHWKILQPGIETNLDDLPSGKALTLKAYILGESRINAWGYVVKRGETT